jgi:hypothetical protein
VDNLECSAFTHSTDMSETGEDRLVMYAQMASIVQQMVSPDEVNVKEVTQTICRVSPRSFSSEQALAGSIS